METPVGSITRAQYEILDVVWNAGEHGSTVTEIWNAISERREVTRTTVLNQVDRLEGRGWLKRRKDDAGFRFLATKTREQATNWLVSDFVESFFGGSAGALAMNLLGKRKIGREEAAQLRKLLDEKSKK